MAAKSKKRLSKNENKLLKLDKLELSDVICSICQSILIEPVTLPCYHDFCQHCFSSSIENNALCCPLCRLRIGSWLRRTSKQKCLVNIELWKFIKNRFTQEIEKKLRGEDLDFSPETPKPRLSQPGEIRSEYEAEIKRLREERLHLEHKHLQETENLIKKLQDEEEEGHKRYTERLQQDELLALKIQRESMESDSTETHKQPSIPSSTAKHKMKPTKIDSYLCKTQNLSNKSTHTTKENSTSSASSTATSKVSSIKPNNRHSPEITPTYGKLFKNFLEKKNKNGTAAWNKENGKITNTKSEVVGASYKDTSTTADRNLVKTKNVMQSLVVSLPLPCSGILHQKVNEPDNRNLETGSVDSMRQELCYFKPIEGTSPTSFNIGKTLPLRVPGLRVDTESPEATSEAPPSRAQYLQGLCQLRNLSLAQRLPSAFVVALGMLRPDNDNSVKCVTRSKVKKLSPVTTTPPRKKNGGTRNKQTTRIDGIEGLTAGASLRRTRSMGSMAKTEHEVTPKKKTNSRQVSSERKPYLRSDSKKVNAKKQICSSPILEESINNNKVNLVVKNLSSPLDNCDVKNILREQLRIERMIEQEKSDFALAQEMAAELSGRGRLRRAAAKRLAVTCALGPAKKLKV